MKKYLDHPLVPLKQEHYLTLIVILAASLYFLSGINIDIYSPSMPTIAESFLQKTFFNSPQFVV